MTLAPDVNLLEGNATDSVTLTCSWDTTVFYLVWFKDGTLLYSKDLVSGVTVDNTGASVEVEVGGQNSTLTFSQVNDSGNYTCALTCRAKDSAEGDIPMQYKATKEVLIYGGWRMNLQLIMFTNEVHGVDDMRIGLVTYRNHLITVM